MTSAPAKMLLNDELMSVTTLKTGSNTDQLMRSNGVVAGAEFDRINALPRRMRTFIDPELLTRALKRPEGTITLRPTQAECLSDIYSMHGLVARLPAGEGKSLVSLLAPQVFNIRLPDGNFMGHKRVERPVLLVPAKLRHKAEKIDIPFYAQHFYLHENLRVISNQLLQQPKNQKLLYRYMPDMIIMDEAQEYRNVKAAARVKRLMDYLKEYPETIIVVLSASLFKKRIRDAAHLMHIALKPHAREDGTYTEDPCPIPRGYHELQQWCDAVDEDVSEGKRVAPGVLRFFCNQDETIEQGFQRRVNESYGVVATMALSCDAALNIFQRQTPIIPPEVVRSFKTMRDTQETLSGDVLTDQKNIWKRCKEMAYGFYYRWRWPNDRPDVEWLDKRRTYRKFVRETIQNAHKSKNLDSEKKVREAAEAGVVDFTSWRAWKEVRERYDPNKIREAVWISDYLLHDVVKDIEPKTIIWVEHIAVGERLSQLSGLPFFAGGATAVEDFVNADKGPCILSIKAHGEGRNLQNYNKSIWLACPSGGDIVDQTLARQHRQGQKHDEVEAEFYLHCRELWEAFHKARDNAKWLHDMGQPNRLVIATIDVMDADAVRSRMASGDPLWGL